MSLTIYLNDLKRIFRNKAQFLVVLFLPFVFISFAYFAHSSYGPSARVGIVDNDNTLLTEMFAASLEEKVAITEVKEEEIQKQLANSTIDYAVIVAEGFTEKVINKEEPKIKGFTFQGADITQPVKLSVDSFLAAAHNIALAAGGDSEEFFRGMDIYMDGSFQANLTTIERDGRIINFEISAIGFLVLGMLIITVMNTFALIEERENKVFYRILSAPVTLRGYMLQSIFSFLTLSIFQIILTLLIMSVVFKAYLGPSVLPLFLVLAVFSLVCVSLSTALASFAKTQQQASASVSLIMMTMSMLGGVFWPRSIMPEILQQIGSFLPTTWVIEAGIKALKGDTLAAMSKDISILLLFALVFFLLGSWRKVDVSK